MEIEEQNALNLLEIKKKQADIMLWKRNEGANIPFNDLEFENIKKK